MSILVLSYAFASIALFFGMLYRKRQPRLPPGPRAWPIVGSYFDLPKSRPWEKYREWCETYGKSFYPLVNRF